MLFEINRYKIGEFVFQNSIIVKGKAGDETIQLHKSRFYGRTLKMPYEIDFKILLFFMTRKFRSLTEKCDIFIWAINENDYAY